MTPPIADRPRRHFIVKHDLASLETLPNFVWRTNHREMPHRFNQISRGDRWIAFAYTTSDYRERPLSLVTGFYECTKEAWHGPLPRRALAAGNTGIAWLIEGKPWGRVLPQAVGVPPLEELLRKPTWKNQAIIPIASEDFRHIRDYAFDHQLDLTRIPLLGREPHNEQELLAAVVYGHRELGIAEIIRVRKAFPDLLVRIHGKREPVHLELEVYGKGFTLHGHDRQVRNGYFKEDGKPVAVLCWINNDATLKTKVPHVFELRSLIQRQERIRWQSD